MKTSPRIHRNGATKPAATQTKTSRRAPAKRPPDVAPKDFGGQFRLPKDALNHACLCVFDRHDQEPANKVPLTEQEYENLWGFALSKNTTVPQFTADAIRLKLELPNMYGALGELDRAVEQSNALHWLLYESLDGAEGGTWSDGIKCGIVELISSTQSRLEKSAESLRGLLSPKPAEVLS
jgi:hypothetical protein